VASLKGRHGPSKLNVYPCLVLAGWHVGNMPPGGREGARRSQAYKATQAT
jgi:hypothetical protein